MRYSGLMALVLALAAAAWAAEGEFSLFPQTGAEGATGAKTAPAKAEPPERGLKE